jgi:hypothetical protein
MEEDLFKSLAQEEPDKEIDEEDEDISNVPASSLEREATSSNDSDLQTTLKMLNPTFQDVEMQDIAPVIMEGRVFPDNFFNKVNLLTIESIKANRHNKNFSHIFTMMKWEGMCQIGYMGKNRVETVIVSGNATKEQAEQENTRGIS